jgi:hypothetical protein
MKDKTKNLLIKLLMSILLKSIFDFLSEIKVLFSFCKTFTDLSLNHSSKVFSFTLDFSKLALLDFSA